MRYESEEKKNLIFDLMNGSLVLDEVKDLWKDQVVDENILHALEARDGQ